LKQKILIIDDSRVDCKIMAKVLLNADPSYEIIFNYDGNSVYNQIMKENISVIILDLMIESIDGIDILKEIKSNDMTSQIPIIICSSIDDKEVIKRTLTYGAYDYFEKPLNDMSLEFGFSLKVKNAIESKLKTDHLNFLQNYDSLTGLGTRKYFETELHKAIIRKSLPISVIMIDVNGLKVINDAYGHDIGDNILVEISQVLNNVSGYISCLSRWGSDEMVMLLPFSGKAEIDKTIYEINHKLEGIKAYNYNISFGWATEEIDSNNAAYIVRKAEDNLYSNKILERSSIRSNMIESFIKTLHHKNPREENHSHRVSLISEKISIELGFSEYEIKRVKVAGLMHDIGKISISEEVLNKPGRLNDSEWNQIKKHPEYGFKILSSSVDTLEIAKAVLAHHERWDGKGYPKGIAGESIPIMARIIAVADTYDAITSERTYREPMNENAAIEEINNCSGSQFDQKVKLS